MDRFQYKQSLIKKAQENYLLLKRNGLLTDSEKESILNFHQHIDAWNYPTFRIPIISPA